MIQKKSDDAISPVIGVMLMLVVTVVIAAAVTIFATGVVGETEAAPVAVLDVEIFSNKKSLEGYDGDDSSGPELFITHLSGDSVDTADIELRFSWTHDGCSHYSTYSADGFTKSGTSLPRDRTQALYVKMTGGEGSGLDHYFGKVILTPGLTLTASSEFLDTGTHTHSQFMDAIFDNYNVSTHSDYRKYHNVKISQQTTHDINTCNDCQFYINDGADPLKWCQIYKNYIAYVNGYCITCQHDYNICTEENDPNFNCKCSKTDYISDPILTGGIMSHLPPGTAVDVMIVHTPSNKAIYDKTVIVE